MAKVDVDQSKKLQGLLNIHGADLQLERTSQYDIKDAESSQAFVERARAVVEEKVYSRCDEAEADRCRRQRFAEVLNQLNQPAGDWEELDNGGGNGSRREQEWRYGRHPLDLNSQSIAAKKTMPSVYVGNLPLSVNKRDLAGLFSSCGEVHDIWLANLKPGVDYTCTYGFVRYYDHESCVLACERMRGVEMEGRTLRVNLADESIHDRSQKDTLVRQEPVGRYYPKTQNCEEKKLVWALRQSCSTYHSQHVLYANKFFLQLKDPQPGAGFCANRLVVDFDEVLSWLDDIPEDLSPAVGDEGPAYTLQEGREELLQQGRATLHNYSTASARSKNQQRPVPNYLPQDSNHQPTRSPRTFATPPAVASPTDAKSVLEKSDSETTSPLGVSDSPIMASLGSSNGHETTATNTSDSTKPNTEESNGSLLSRQTSDTEISGSTKSMFQASDTSPTMQSSSFKNFQEINMYLKKPALSSSSQEGRVHSSTEGVTAADQLSPIALAALHSSTPGRPVRRASPRSRRHYRSPQCLHPTSAYHVPGAPYPTMLSTSVPTAFTSEMFEMQDNCKSSSPISCPVGELVNLDDHTPNEVQLIELDSKEFVTKTDSHTRELVALFENSDATSQEHKDQTSGQSVKSNLQLLEELLAGCELCACSDSVGGLSEGVGVETDTDINIEADQGIVK